MADLVGYCVLSVIVLAAFTTFLKALGLKFQFSLLGLMLFIVTAQIPIVIFYNAGNNPLQKNAGTALALTWVVCWLLYLLNNAHDTYMAEQEKKSSEEIKK